VSKELNKLTIENHSGILNILVVFKQRITAAFSSCKITVFFSIYDELSILLTVIHRPSKPKAREGRQVNEDKSRVKRF